MTARKTAALRDDARHAPLLDAAERAAEWTRAANHRARSVAALGLAEARLAALGAGAMVFFAVAAAVLALSAWGLAMALIVVLAELAGLALWQALLGLVAIHVAASVLCWKRAVGLTAHLEFAETRRQIARLIGQEDAGNP